jgi:hypothetical protein
MLRPVSKTTAIEIFDTLPVTPRSYARAPVSNPVSQSMSHNVANFMSYETRGAIFGLLSYLVSKH